MVTVDRLDPLPPVVAGGVTFLVDRSRPVAVRDGGGSVRVVTWPDAPLPARSASASVLAAPGCVWVAYTEDGVDDPGLDRCTAVRVGLDGQVAGCEPGAPTPIGADEVGLWVVYLDEDWPPPTSTSWSRSGSGKAYSPTGRSTSTAGPRALRVTTSPIPREMVRRPR